MEADGLDASGITFYDTADEMLDRELLDGVVVGTRCSLHASMGVKVLRRGIALFLEKPIATKIEDLMALKAHGSDKVVVSFPLRITPVVKLAHEIINSGKLGKIEHVQAWNNVPYGNVYFQTWYRDENETQGLFLQKATHDLDYINFLLGDNKPTVVSAMTSKQIFKGDHPAKLKCMDCAERTLCHESPYHTSRALPKPLDQPAKEMCAFAVDTGNEDSGSALIRYESGMHAIYSQNFFVRGKAARRGARFIGYHGTLEFDWYPEHLNVVYHHEARVERHEFSPNEDGHGGGDGALASNFINVIRGTETSLSPLESAIENALLCLKARQSALTQTFQKVQFTEEDEQIYAATGAGPQDLRITR
jgi:predicted dehydrogenase